MTPEEMQRDYESCDWIGAIDINGKFVGLGAWVNANTFEAEYADVQDVRPGDIIVIDHDTYAVLGQRTNLEGDSRPEAPPGRVRRGLVAFDVRLRT